MARSARTSHLVALGLGLACCGLLFPDTIDLVAGIPATAPAGAQGRRGAPPKQEAPPDPKQLLEGTDEDDDLSGGTGEDWVFGGGGNDRVRGNAGRDRIDGGEGDDAIDAGPDADIVDAGPGLDHVRGGDGDDVIDGSDDDDFLDGGAGMDNIDGGDGNDVLRGGADNDELAGGDEDDLLRGEAGDDRMSGNDGADTLAGGAGDDVLMGGEGDDNLAGEAGADRLDGGRGNDVLRGGPGEDTLLGSAGDDGLNGGPDHDTLLGSDGLDVLDGGPGHDWLLGGTGADVLNGGDGDDLIVIRAGDVPADGIEVLNGGTGSDALILNGFSKAVPVADSMRLSDPVTGGAAIASSLERVEYTQVLAQVDHAADRRLSVLLVNPSQRAVAGRVMFFGPEGDIVQAAAPGGGTGNDDLEFTVEPLGSLRLEAVAPGPAVAQVFAEAPLGSMVYGGIAGPVAAAVGPAPLVDSAIIPILEDPAAGVSTGLLLANSVTTTAIKLSVNAANGAELDSALFHGSHQLELPAYGHRLIFIRDAFASVARLPQFQGTLTIDGGVDRPQEGGPIVAVLLERGPDGQVAMSPAVSVNPAPAAGPVFFAQVASGGGTSSSIVLVNPSRAVSAQGTLQFLDEGGAPWAVSANQQGPAASVPFDIGPGGSAVFALGGSGALQRGSARVRTTQGGVSGLLRVMAAGTRAHVPPSGVFSSFIAAVRRDQASQTSTSVSLSSTGPASRVQLTLRTAAGESVAGGTAELQLPANGLITRSVDELFPSIGTGTFDGSLAVVADGGPVAATVLQTQPGAAPVVLPIIELQ